MTVRALALAVEELRPTQFFIGELAAWKLGATYVPLNPIYTEDELVGPLTDTT